MGGGIKLYIEWIVYDGPVKIYTVHNRENLKLNTLEGKWTNNIIR